MQICFNAYPVYFVRLFGTKSKYGTFGDPNVKSKVTFLLLVKNDLTPREYFISILNTRIQSCDDYTEQGQPAMFIFL